MIKVYDHLGTQIHVGSTVIYVGAGYTTFERKVVTKISKKTVTLGEPTQWGSVTRRPFDSVIVLDAITELWERSDKLAALEAGGVDNWDGYGFCFEDEEGDD